MIRFLLDNLGTIIVGAVVLAVLAGIVVKLVRDRKKGKACACGCDGCPSAEICHKK